VAVPWAVVGTERVPSPLHGGRAQITTCRQYVGGVKHTAGRNGEPFLPAGTGLNSCGRNGREFLRAGTQNFVTFIDTRSKITAPSQHLGLPGGAAGAIDMSMSPTGLRIGLATGFEFPTIVFQTRLGLSGMQTLNTQASAFASDTLRIAIPVPFRVTTISGFGFLTSFIPCTMTVLDTA